MIAYIHETELMSCSYGASLYSIEARASRDKVIKWPHTVKIRVYAKRELASREKSIISRDTESLGEMYGGHP